MVAANIKVTLLAKITGQSFLKIPYISQSKTPEVKSEYITKERSRVCFVRIAFIACGKNAVVVKHAASNPIIVVSFIFLAYVDCVKI